MVQFDDEQFRDYVRKIDDPAAWEPVPFSRYSPSIAEEHSEIAHQRFDLPIDPPTTERTERLENSAEILAVSLASTTVR